MTCVVGIQSAKNIWIGGDAIAATTYSKRQTALSKVFRIDDRFLVGYCGSFRMGQLLQFGIQIPEQDPTMTDHEYMVSVFIDAVRQCFKSNGFSEVDNNVESGGNFIVGYRDTLYEIYHDFSVDIPYDRYAAIGSAKDYALGSLHATQQWGLAAALRIDLALEAAEHFSPYALSPFTTLSLYPESI
jgi:20S proteasome alpha/beta subunit